MNTSKRSRSHSLLLNVTHAVKQEGGPDRAPLPPENPIPDRVSEDDEEEEDEDQNQDGEGSYICMA